MNALHTTTTRGTHVDQKLSKMNDKERPKQKQNKK
jgi:hypothetical protein